jgi:hypothetical protein
MPFHLAQLTKKKLDPAPIEPAKPSSSKNTALMLGAGIVDIDRCDTSLRALAKASSLWIWSASLMTYWEALSPVTCVREARAIGAHVPYLSAGERWHAVDNTMHIRTPFMNLRIWGFYSKH